MKEKTWIEVNVEINPSLLDVLSNGIFSLGAEGLEEADNQVKIYFQKNRWDASTLKSLTDMIHKYHPEFDASTIQIKDIPYQDWTENWKDSFKRFHLTENIIVKPDWDDYHPKKDEIVITISPKMAFGTGHHETTQLVMLMLQKYIKNGDHVLDAGAGSGILAVLAAKLGARRITAFDNDPIVLENIRENFSLNEINIQTDIICGTLGDIKKSEYDVITANIDRNVLLELPEKFINYIKPDGILILSGLLSRDEDKILTGYEEYNWQVIEKEQKGAWLALALKHK
ncbi:MAG TPA: 50S ribosomal protein L11 methyltransferase [Caldithrix sp.]|nr:50S ribosomal protein L11 methyltransferase [Calditrichaceae bacterium]HEM48982.1 50S ribosomal protein L11 methyltransferase [Caldithrix sp.]HES60191.1 50S ribosomal protein L11 methyltransferase [Caldithrix sp.]